MKSCPMRSCPMKSWRGHHAVDVEAGKLHFVVGDRLVGECPYLGNAQSRGSRHYGSEVHLRIAEREIAVAVGDLALVRAGTADRYGNLTFRYAQMNFGPVTATAAGRNVTADLDLLYARLAHVS